MEAYTYIRTSEREMFSALSSSRQICFCFNCIIGQDIDIDATSGTLARVDVSYSDMNLTAVCCVQWCNYAMHVHYMSVHVSINVCMWMCVCSCDQLRCMYFTYQEIWCFCPNHSVSYTHTNTHCDPSSSQFRIKKLIAFSSWDIEYYHVDSLGFGFTQLKSTLSFSLSVSFAPHSFGIYKSCSQHFQFHLNEWTFYHSLYFSHIRLPFSLYLFASLLFWENVSCNRNTWTVSKRDWLWNGEFYGSFYAYRTSLAKSFNCFSSV